MRERERERERRWVREGGQGRERESRSGSGVEKRTVERQTNGSDHSRRQCITDKGTNNTWVHSTFVRTYLD